MAIWSIIKHRRFLFVQACQCIWHRRDLRNHIAFRVAANTAMKRRSSILSGPCSWPAKWEVITITNSSPVLQRTLQISGFKSGSIPCLTLAKFNSENTWGGSRPDVRFWDCTCPLKLVEGFSAIWILRFYNTRKCLQHLTAKHGGHCSK